LDLCILDINCAVMQKIIIKSVGVKHAKL
jgi:hypothetical protein